ncbi:MAG: hypothetical protein E6H66_12850 [Betaproteobacteria bacterium]|nr:MAG: hypothetical protein E6H66_12850 [Betaproteobacteria bacterium]
MKHSLLDHVVAKAATLLAGASMAFSFFVAAPVHAAQVTLSVSSCDSFTLSGTAPNQTLTCVVSAAPANCSIQGPSAGSVGSPITLNAVCGSGAPTQWSWTGGHCQGVTTQSCTGTETNVGSVTYGMTASNGIGSAPAASTSVSWSNAPPLVPSGCTATANPSSLPAGGGSTTLTVTCSGGGAPTQYLWVPAYAGMPQWTTVNSQTAFVPQSTIFSITPYNASGVGNTAQVSVTVSGGGGGNVGLSNCTNQGFAVIPAATVSATWGSAGTWQSTQAGSFGDGAVWVFQITPPSGTPASSIAGRFVVSEFQGLATPRQLTISATPCDFRARDYTGANGPLAVSNGSTASIAYQVAASFNCFLGGSACLTAGTTYYVSARNWQLDPSPNWSCGQTSCNAIMNDSPASP